MSADIHNSYDWKWFAERLDDPSLLEDAEDVGAPFECSLAVPVGGKRRGGYVGVTSPQEGRELVRYLRKFPGFPNPQYRRDRDGGEVFWGEPEPTRGSGAVAFGRYYGYSEEAIRAFMVEQYGEAQADEAMAS